LTQVTGFRTAGKRVILRGFGTIVMVVAQFLWE
jgi:hypothetical protein